MKEVFSIALILLCTGCAHLHYRHVEPGRFHGNLIIRWVAPDRFEFIQDPDQPFCFERSDGSLIVPRSMYTDGGSTPRILWSIPEFSPWGYAPAFVIHDWLFLAHFCNDPIDGHYSLEESAWIMSEGMKTLMLTHTNLPVRKDAMYSMYNAVRSPIARTRWEHTPCPLLNDASAREPHENMTVQPAN